MPVEKPANIKKTQTDDRLQDEENPIKCVIWDLDNTVWQGTLLEDKEVFLRDGITDILKTLDLRGILHSICSKNDRDLAMAALKRFGIDEYFLYPEISFENKSTSVERIIKNLNIGQDTIAFIDDEPYELDEVKKFLPAVMCISATETDRLTKFPALNPRIVTEDSRNRRKMYISDIKRDESENEFTGPKEEFLKTLSMEITIAAATENDLDRLTELTERTNQMNTTGYPYSREDLSKLAQSEDHMVLAISLKDKYGDSGKIGLALIEKDDNNGSWTIELFIMSCRVATRGVGSVVLNCITRNARDKGVKLYAKFRDTGRNKLMFLSFGFAGFKAQPGEGECMILSNDFSAVQETPEYMKVIQSCEKFYTKPE